MNVFELYASIILNDDEYRRGLDEAATHTSTFGSKLKNVLGTAGKVAAAGIGLATTAVVGLTKSCVEGYAEFEQLTGGVETLFDTSAWKVREYADNAYKTAGLSANQYMETVTSFSASLLQSLGGDTAKAAEYADQAITDMADNANKMGTSMEMIQNAYSGFAKANYTMLDNLKLGYGGTKEEMERLLADASRLAGVQFDISSYADVIEAIHVVQTEMGITGTTAKEASETISGSVAAMGSAWENLVVGIADKNANLENLVGNFVDSVATVAGNIIPLVHNVINGIGQAVEKLVPAFMELLPSILVDTIPNLVGVAVTIVQSLANALAGNVRELVPAVVEMFLKIVETLTDPTTLGNLMDAALTIIIELARGIIDSLPALMERVPEIIENLVTAINENAPKLLNAALILVETLLNGIVEALPGLFDAGIDILLMVITGILSAIPKLVETAWTVGETLIETLVDMLPDVVEIGKDIVRGLWEGIQSLASWLSQQVGGFFDDLFGTVKDHEEIHSPSKKWGRIGRDDARGVGVGWTEEMEEVREQFADGMDFDVERNDPTDNGGGFPGGQSGEPREIVLNITETIDGQILARNQYRYNTREGQLRGATLVEG